MVLYALTARGQQLLDAVIPVPTRSLRDPVARVRAAAGHDRIAWRGAR